MDDIASFAVWLCIALLLMGNAMSVIGGLPFFQQAGLNPAMKPYEPQGAISGITGWLAGIADSIVSPNYVSSSTPSVSTDATPKFDQVQTGLFTKLVEMFYGWNRIAGYFSHALGSVGAIIFIFTSFVEVIQLVGLLILLSKVAMIAKLFIPFVG